MNFCAQLFFMTLIFPFILTASAEEADTTHLGHDYPRKQLRNAAELSSKDVEKKSSEVLAAINRRISPEDEENHYAYMATHFASEQGLWQQYRDSTCLLQAYAYVYPSSSRMFLSQQDACIHEMNGERLRYLNDLLQNIS